ncbi:MAG: hypothetical protein ABI675_30140 [Chitinophagaceae bacterium]
MRLLLRQQNFQAFKAYVDNSYSKQDVSFTWELLRTVVSGYQEGMVKVDAKDSTSRAKELYLYRLNLITSGNQIIFYDLQKKKIDDRSYMTFETEEIFRSEKAMSDLERKFKDIYTVDLNYNDLFQNSIVYGRHCGIAGENPEYLQKLDVLLENQDVEEISRWLKSANAEKQLYAIRGYKYLASQGYKLSEEEKGLLTIAGKKDGLVSVCSGCTYWSEDFQTVLSEISSSSVDDLKPEKPREMYGIGLGGHSARKKSYPFTTILGMSALFLISVYNLLKYIRSRRHATGKG